MTHTTDGHASASARGPLPEPPGPPGTWRDRESRLRDQANALDVLIREDLSRGRALAFLLCAGVVTLVAAFVPVMVVDAAGSESREATDVAVAAALSVLLVAIAVSALLVLKKLRKRSVQRHESLQQWAAVDRGHDAEFPARCSTQGYPHGRFFYTTE
ncbi:hypothetical protein ACIQI8_23395 [Streptomyces sp. NPDC092369]|uniref:hypothetical protein n=1 Tax=Streptomyces sp. NPDC092369 TaxID=3366015 RepID=UPI0038070C06